MLKLIATMYRNKFLCLLLFILCAATLSAQDDNTKSLDSFTARFITAIRANASDRAYITSDKSVYKAGEYVWFDAFLLNTISQKLSSKSRLLFVDVVNKDDSVVKRLMLDATGRQMYARIQLPDTLSSGDYWLRAYTKRMTIQDSVNIGIKPLYVAGKTDDYRTSRNIKKQVNSDSAVIHFYPEGGNVITGIECTIAVTASEGNGAPLSIAISIKDSRDTVVAKFTTNANGLGKFQFEPSGYRRYKAVINYNDKEWTYPLPAYDYFKGQIAAVKQSDAYQLRVLLGDSIYKKDALSYVVGIAKDSLVFAAFGKGLYQVNVEESKLPAGITTFYLFDTKFNLLSERAVYVNEKAVRVDIATDKSSYKTREKVTLNVAVTNAAQQPIPTLISVAVSDSAFGDIPSCVLPNINNAKFTDNLFFATHTCFSDEERDLLMLTKSNTYPALTATQRPALPDEDSLFYISGKVLSRRNEATANKIVTLISDYGNAGLFYTDTTDNSGQFRFALESLPDSIQYSLQVKDMNNHALNTDIITDEITYPRLKMPLAIKQQFAAMPKAAIDEVLRKYDAYAFENDAHQLSPVTVKEQKNIDYDVSKRVSTTSAVISGRDLDGRTSLGNLILRVGGLQLVNGYLVMQGLFSMSGAGAATEPMVLVNGVEIPLSANASVGTASPVLSYLNTLNPRDIDFIEVLKGGDAANYGVRGANGVIIINPARKVRLLDAPGGNNIKTFYASGITRPISFPVTVPNDKDKKATLQPDLRTTVFWNGHFITSEAGKAVFTLSTSDIPTTYTVTITGVTQRGDFVYKTTRFKSK